MKRIDDIIEELLESAAHGTTEKDVKKIWNAAIDEAVAIVRENYDECEPWVNPEDVEALRV